MEERSYLSCWPWLLAGLLGLGLLGWLATRGAPDMRDAVQTNAQEALEANAHLYARAQVNDGVLLVTGEAPNEAARAAACKAAADAISGKGFIGLPGVISRYTCQLTVPGGATPAPAVAEPAAPATPATPTAPAAPAVSEIVATNPEAANCQTRLTTAAASGSVNFRINRAEIITGTQVLDQIAAIAQECSGFAIEVGGHTDVRGDEAMNVALSQARADAVRTYLTGKGVAAGQLTARGYGETAPLDPAMTVEAHRKNRRTEFKITAAVAAAPAAQ